MRTTSNVGDDSIVSFSNNDDDHDDEDGSSVSLLNNKDFKKQAHDGLSRTSTTTTTSSSSLPSSSLSRIFILLKNVLLLVYLVIKSLFNFLLLRLGVHRPKPTLFLKHNFAPVFDELEDNVELKPSVPLWSDFPPGVFIRNGPNPQYIQPRGDHHWFDGDGHLHSISISSDLVIRYKNRYVRTEKYVMEKEYQQPILYGIRYFGNPLIQLDYLFQKWFCGLRDKRRVPKSNAANTSIEFHHGKCLALFEADVPYEIELPSLKTVGPYDFHGQLRHNMTAHPKIDPITGEFIFFGYQVRPGLIRYGIADKKGNISHSVDFKETPFGTIMHDFACTENYSIINFFPLKFQPKRILEGHGPFHFDTKDSTKIAVIPRRYQPERDRVMWFEASSGYAFHTVNAYEDGDEIVMRACLADEITLDLDITDLNDPNNQTVKARLYEWRLNVKTGQIKETSLKLKNVDEPNGEPHELYGEFPVINDDYECRKNRFCWLGIFQQNYILMQSVAKVDFETMTYKSYFFGAHESSGEWALVKKLNAQEEDDVYAMSFVFNDQTNTTTFQVVDGKTMDKVTRVPVPRRVPYGFHGKYIPATDYQQ